MSKANGLSSGSSWIPWGSSSSSSKQPARLLNVSSQNTPEPEVPLRLVSVNEVIIGKEQVNGKEQANGKEEGMGLGQIHGIKEGNGNEEAHRIEAHRNGRTQSTGSSLATAPGSWLSWSKARSFSESAPNGSTINKQSSSSDRSNEKALEDDNEEIPDYQKESNDDEDDDDEDQKKGNEVEENVHILKKSSWNFWSSSDKKDDKVAAADTVTSSRATKQSEADPVKESVQDKKESVQNQKDQKDQKKPIENLGNTILSSKHLLPGLPGGSLNGHISDPKKYSSNPEDKDDAVLYKPHTDVSQFNEINMHKNENLKKNVIVPDWDLCLSYHSDSTSSSSLLFGDKSTTNNSVNLNNKMEFLNWRQFVNQLSNRLGFSLLSLTSVVQEEKDKVTRERGSGTNSNDVETEFSLLYEKTYHLYGRSLAKLPELKRACLPNFDKEFSTCERGEGEGEDQDISVSNDPMGNFLINQKPRNVPYEIHSAKTTSLRKIKKILIIGVHGFFPTRMVRPFIGAPKGTSLKFANEAEKSVIRYCYENGLMTEHESFVSIQKIALEQEGKILDRVEFFSEVLKKWLKELNDADFIFVAAHSQGCVVSIILLARLMQLGILKDPIHKRIGLLGMAGVNNGPFYGTDQSIFMKAYSAIENESMLELFELNKFTSPQSLAYKELLQTIINANVKICFIGSINDQLVPLYSAAASHVFHPNIYRACYIDYSLQTPSFIRKLVSLCCQLQNLGYFDNNVIKELSSSLAGPLTGNGHSKIYNDGKVYDLGLKFALDTDDIVIPQGTASELKDSNEVPPSGLVTSGIGTYGLSNLAIPTTNQIYIKEYNISKLGSNPFILPWCLRGLLFNIEKNWPDKRKRLTVEMGDEIGKTGYDEIKDLDDLFEAWRPETKAFKELKYRLNGLRASKL